MSSSAIAEKPTLRSTSIDRQKRERELLFDLYRLMPQKTEYRFMRASRIAEAVGATASFVDAAVRTFEACGIISRRLEFGAIRDGKVITGRSFHWTLLLSLEEALEALEKYHSSQREFRTSSLKTRIMDALVVYKHFPTMDDLTKAITQPGDNLDRHNMTHVLMVLVKEGKITLDRGRTKDRIPYNISLSKNGERSLLQTINEEVIVVQPEETEVIEEATFDVPVTVGEKYPIIRRLVKRRAWLEEAAKLAEDAAEEDLAISLLERSNKPMSPLETEAVDMFFELFAIYEKR